MASWNVTGTPQNLDMLSVYARSSDYEGLARMCRFVVTITPSGANNLLVGAGYGAGGMFSDLVYLTEAAEYPSRGFESIETRYYGPKIRMPVNSEYEDTTLTFLCRNMAFERQLFDDWQAMINPTSTYDFNYKVQYAAVIRIFELTERNVASYCWSLMDAWPSLVQAQPVTWADDQFLRLQVTFNYTKWLREGRDPPSGTYNLVSFGNPTVIR